MKVMVTGGRGFIGHHLVRRLMQEGAIKRLVRVSRQACEGHPLLETGRLAGLPVLDDARCELTDRHDVRELMRTHRPDVIFHLAADPIIKRCEEDPFAVFSTNVSTTHHLLEYCPEGCRFVLASSAAVYGDRACYGADENQAPSPTSAYGASKVAAEALCLAYQELGKVRSVCLRLVANVGRGASHGVVRDLLCKFLSDATELDVIGTHPGSTKHYVHVDETARAFVHFGLSASLSGTYNVANDDAISVLSLASALMRAAGKYKSIRWLGEEANWKGDNRTVLLSNKKASWAGWHTKQTSYDAVFLGVTDMLRERGSW